MYDIFILSVQNFAAKVLQKFGIRKFFRQKSEIYRTTTWFTADVRNLFISV